MLGSADAQESRADGGTMKRLGHILLGFPMLIASACSQSPAAAPVTAMINATPPPPILAGDASLVGFCKAKDGSGLPGVTVTIRDAAGHQQTEVTDVQGSFAFRMILPGQYTIRWELAGYGTATRVVTVAAGKTADGTGTLNPSVMESITVTAEAPLLDVRRSGP